MASRADSLNGRERFIQDGRYERLTVRHKDERHGTPDCDRKTRGRDSKSESMNRP